MAGNGRQRIKHGNLGWEIFWQNTILSHVQQCLNLYFLLAIFLAHKMMALHLMEAAVMNQLRHLPQPAHSQCLIITATALFPPPLSWILKKQQQQICHKCNQKHPLALAHSAASTATAGEGIPARGRR